MIVYGTVRFRFFGEPAVAELTEHGWITRTDEPESRSLDVVFDLLADPREFGPADGDRMAAAVSKLAGILRGTYELTPLPAAPAGTIY